MFWQFLISHMYKCGIYRFEKYNFKYNSTIQWLSDCWDARKMYKSDANKHLCSIYYGVHTYYWKFRVINKAQVLNWNVLPWRLLHSSKSSYLDVVSLKTKPNFYILYTHKGKSCDRKYIAKLSLRKFAFYKGVALKKSSSMYYI